MDLKLTSAKQIQQMQRSLPCVWYIELRIVVLQTPLAHLQSFLLNLR